MSLAALALQLLLAGARREALDPDDDHPCPHLVELHRRGTREIFDVAVAACASPAEDERTLGVRILRELGGPPPAFAADAVPVLLPMLARETSPELLGWIISALGYQHMSGHLREPLQPTPAVLAAALTMTGHPAVRVRFALAAALTCLVDLAAPAPAAIRALVDLASDPDALVRDYALIALTDELNLLDRPEVRAAVERGLTDDHNQIRVSARRVLAGGSWLED